MRGAFVERRRARLLQQCTCCGAFIGRGDEYERSATPPWHAWGDRWEIVSQCFDCLGAAA